MHSKIEDRVGKQGGGVNEGKAGVCQVRVSLKVIGIRCLCIWPAVSGLDIEKERGQRKREGGRSPPTQQCDPQSGNPLSRQKCRNNLQGNSRDLSKLGGRQCFCTLLFSMAVILAKMRALFILCLASATTKVGDFHALAMVCLATVVSWMSNRNWVWVSSTGLRAHIHW